MLVVPWEEAEHATITERGSTVSKERESEESVRVAASRRMTTVADHSKYLAAVSPNILNLKVNIATYLVYTVYYCQI